MHNQTNNRPIIVMGGNGRVGREVVRYLLRHTYHEIIIASRSAHSASVTTPNEPRLANLVLDANDHQAMRQAFAEAALVIACIGPSGVLGERVARACIEMDTPLIDAGGYDPLLKALEARQRQEPVNVPLIISVGLMPGLTGLFPKYVIDSTAHGRTPLRLDTCCIGRDAWTYNSAWDIVHSLGDFGQDRGFPIIRHGAHQSVGFFRAMRKVNFPGQIGRVSTMLMPSEELARLAGRLKIPEARAYGSNVGPRAALACLRAKLFGQFRTPEQIHRAAQRLARASARDLRNLQPVYGLRVDVTYADEQRESATLVIADTYQATGVAIAITARCLLEGDPLANGVQLLHEAIDSRRFMQLFRAEGLLAIDGLTAQPHPEWQGGLS
ncbi:saccharopine dehydrogenase family protein [Pseudomonas cremoricolorata]|uniref:saccharopine dehydrogenase family protein n=1 Tax=Pseudomonas cremoricolorata TaxID=157783 RepID=UPI000675F404|nr:saccharopine dehydrogenase NADP-binding domain-containing protein [Pseudomonas cremoricolorata]